MCTTLKHRIGHIYAKSFQEADDAPLKKELQCGFQRQNLSAQEDCGRPT